MMNAGQLVILDPEPGRECFGICHRADLLARRALGPREINIRQMSSPRVGTIADEPDLVLLRAPSRRPLQETLDPLREVWHSVPVLGAVCNVGANVSELVSTLGHAVDDFFCCSVIEFDFLTRLRRLLPEHSATRAERTALVQGLKLDMLVGQNREFLRTISRLAKVANSDAAALIGGETGVGKELFARAIHYNGFRKSGPFIPINCSALPDHLFENELFGHARGAYTDASNTAKGLLAGAEGGTLFLDEVDTLTPASQAKILRFLQHREYRPLGSGKILTADVRVVAATNADLRQKVIAREFREDLFHRLNILCLQVPPLRERATDIPLLANHFLAQYAAIYRKGEITFAPPALRKMLSYSWPGNVRELESLLHRAVVFSSSNVLTAEDIEIPAASSISAVGGQGLPHGDKDHAMVEFERSYLANLLAEHRGNVSHAARAAGRDRRSFQRLLRKHQIERTRFMNVV
jgi:two-component system response regulator GlrR